VAQIIHPMVQCCINRVFQQPLAPTWARFPGLDADLSLLAHVIDFVLESGRRAAQAARQFLEALPGAARSDLIEVFATRHAGNSKSMYRNKPPEQMMTDLTKMCILADTASTRDLLRLEDTARTKLHRQQITKPGGSKGVPATASPPPSSADGKELQCVHMSCVALRTSLSSGGGPQEGHLDTVHGQDCHWLEQQKLSSHVSPAQGVTLGPAAQQQQHVVIFLIGSCGPNKRAGYPLCITFHSPNNHTITNTHIHRGTGRCDCDIASHIVRHGHETAGNGSDHLVNGHWRCRPQQQHT
jgi:hypothetical protein